MTWLWQTPYLWDLGGLVVRGTNHLIRGSEHSAPPPASGDEREAGDGLTHQWPLNQVCSQNTAAIQNPNNKVQRAPGLVNTAECWECGGSVEGAVSLPTPWLCSSSNYLFLSHILYNETVPVNAAPRSVSHSGKLSDLRGDCGNPWFVTSWLEAQVL